MENLFVTGFLESLSKSKYVDEVIINTDSSKIKKLCLVLI